MSLKKSFSALLILFCCVSFAHAEQDFRLRSNQTSFTNVTEADLDAEIKFGQNIAARILGRVKLLDDKKLNRYVNLVGRTVAMQANRPELEYRFAVLDADYANAYSAPGGYVFITKGAIARMKDEAELAAVLAHEIAHINARHIVNALKIRGKDQSNIGGLSRFLSGGKDSAGGAFLEAVDQAVSLLFDKGYKQEQEHEADANALTLLAFSGYDVNALKRYLKRVEKMGESKQTTTHPSNKARYVAIDTLIKEDGLNTLKGARATSRFKQFASL